jgi:phosphoribosylglycinamide formyltransferase-1
MSKIRIGVLCSGGGTNFQAIVNAQEAGLIPDGELVLVVTDRADAYVLTRAARYGIPTAVCDKKQIPARAEREAAILKTLKEHDVQMVVFAGFMTILSERFVKAYEGCIVNVHPALIPSFCGAGMYGLHVHEAVLARGVKVTGATVHYVTEECDGGPIILQKAVEVKAGDTPEILQKRVMREAEWIILPEAVELVCKKLLKN